MPMAAVTELTGNVDTSERRSVMSVSSGFTRFAVGDVIFAKITPCMENGKIAIVPPVPYGMAAGSTEFHVLEPRKISAPYLFYYLSQSIFRQDAEHHMTGTAGQKRVPTEWLRLAPIPVPPSRDIEMEIARSITDLFEKIEEGEAALTEAQRAAEKYRQALLRAAFTGNLTADWREANPDAETGEALLARLLDARRARWNADPRNARKQYVEPVSPDTAGLPQLPATWTWATLDQLCPHITSGSRDWAAFYDTGDCTFIMAQNVRRGRYDPSFRQVVGPPADHRDRRRTKVERGDLLLTIVGANTGDICQIRHDVEDHFVCQSVALLRPEVPTTALLAELFLASNFGRTLQMEKLIYGAGRPHLNFDQIRSLAVPLAPNAEAQHLVSRQNKLDKELSELRVGMASMADELRQSVLSAAFRGTLPITEQHP